MNMLNTSKKLDDILIFCLLSSPIFSLVVRGWINTLAFICAFISVIILISIKKDNYSTILKTTEDKNLIIFFCISLILPIISIFITELARADWQVKDYDSPSRFLLAIPILLAIFFKKIKISQIVVYIAPITLIVTFLGLPFLPKSHWSEDSARLSTFFVDPLTFGSLSLTFSVMSLAAITQLSNKKYILKNLICIFAFFIGAYFSIKSESRTGWIAIPFILIIFTILNGYLNNIKNFLLLSVTIIALLALIYFEVPIVHERVGLAIHEIQSYQTSPDTSVGLRITFARIGYYLFTLHPFLGCGDQCLASHLKDPAITSFASPYARDFVFHAKFHNEFISRAVLAGVLGLIAILGVFIMPIVFALKGIRNSFSRNTAAIQLLIFTIFELASSLSMEIFNLKFTVSLYTMIITMYCAAILQED